MKEETHDTEGLLVEFIILLSLNGDRIRTSCDVNGTLSLPLFDSFSLEGFKKEKYSELNHIQHSFHHRL